MKVFLPGGAGLVGINLIASIKSSNPEWKLLVVDKKYEAIYIASKIFPDVDFLCEDLTFKENQKWPQEIRGCDACVMLQAEIGTTDNKKFELNNVLTTKVILKELKDAEINRIIHISSSVVNSISNDLYTKTKLKQEELVLKAFPEAIVLRPTLMFGWFDRKHLGWLANFMIKSPIFPIPGRGNFIRQPLFVGDFCSIIKKCVEDYSIQGIYNISGLEKIKYIQLMKMLKKAKSAQTLFIYLPIPIFNFLLKLWALISRQPAFTSSQLHALTAGDQFEVIDWPSVFQINPTQLEDALKVTHQDNRYSNIKMPF
tara:strand:+ start:21770 stop:22708 length:939 start_codon:yes stop_codon:yes gene_type:complete